MPYKNGDPTISEQIEQHRENKALGDEMSACWDEGYAEGRKAINADLTAAAKELVMAAEAALMQADQTLLDHCLERSPDAQASYDTLSAAVQIATAIIGHRRDHRKRGGTP